MKSTDTIRRSVPLLVARLVLLVLLIEISLFGLFFFVEWIIGLSNIELQYIGPILQIFALPIELFATIALIYQWSSVTYELRDNEVTVRTGLIRRTEQSYPFNNMQSVTVRQDIIGRLVRAGTVSVFIPTLGQELTFHEVENPQDFAEKLKQALPYPDKSQYIIRR
jgi:uncharacterized membrane protein YdbT with pleckstrin-like domain